MEQWFSGDENRLEQTKYNVEVMYIQDEKIAKIDNAVGTTCPHCGAPVTNLGAMYCEYCGLCDHTDQFKSFGRFIDFL